MFRALIAHAVTLELFHSRSTGSIPQLLLSGFRCEQSLQQAMKGRTHGPHLPSSAHLESTLAPGGVGDSKEAGCGVSAYLGAELQLRTPHRHHKQVTQCCHFRTRVAPTEPQTFLGLPSGHAVIPCVPFNTAIKASCPEPH